MCYLVAKGMFDHGCIVLRTKHGPELVALKHSLREKLGSERIQLITISKPSAFGEYRPYTFAESQEDFTRMVLARYQ